MAGRPLKIESWTNGDGELCSRFALKSGKHPISVAYRLHKDVMKKHLGYELISIVRVDALSENGRTLWVARWTRVKT